MSETLQLITRKSQDLSKAASELSGKLQEFAVSSQVSDSTLDNFLPLLTIFTLACWVGYYVVWKVTPALHTPLMAVTNAISGIIIIGALLAIKFGEFNSSTGFGVIGIFLAAINIFGGFIVTTRMLNMFKKK